MKLQILIIEDEERSANRLEKLILEARPEVRIVSKCESVAESIEWLKTNPSPDLIFSDIQLSDGLSFEIFERIKVASPVIFTTAYDQYAIRAFKNNGIDYLLKPMVPEELTASLERFSERQNPRSATEELEKLARLAASMAGGSPAFRTRFLIKMGEKFKSFEAPEIVCFEGRDKSTWIVTPDGRSYPIDDTLEKLEQSLNPSKFFRISRKFIVNFDTIKNIETYPNNRLKLTLNGFDADDLIVARERTQAFKQWMES